VEDDLPIPTKVSIIPHTVPNSPTIAAVEPIVARPQRPRLNSAILIAVGRCVYRLSLFAAFYFAFDCAVADYHRHIIDRHRLRKRKDIDGLDLFLKHLYSITNGTLCPESNRSCIPFVRILTQPTTSRGATSPHFGQR
jgi:hypothetical protein